jgi:hypothetical protein
MGPGLLAEEKGSPFGPGRVDDLLSQAMELLAEAAQVRGWLVGQR